MCLITLFKCGSVCLITLFKCGSTSVRLIALYKRGFCAKLHGTNVVSVLDYTVQMWFCVLDNTVQMCLIALYKCGSVFLITVQRTNVVSVLD